MQQSGGPPLGTLANAWLPCRLLDFERDIACLTEDTLMQKSPTPRKPLVMNPT
jgi:hypothetical protein